MTEIMSHTEKQIARLLENALARGEQVTIPHTLTHDWEYTPLDTPLDCIVVFRGSAVDVFMGKLDSEMNRGVTVEVNPEDVSAPRLAGRVYTRRQ